MKKETLTKKPFLPVMWTRVGTRGRMLLLFILSSGTLTFLTSLISTRITARSSRGPGRLSRPRSSGITSSRVRLRQGCPTCSTRTPDACNRKSNQKNLGSIKCSNLSRDRVCLHCSQHFCQAGQKLRLC